MREPRSSTLRIRSSWAAAALTSGTLSGASASVTLKAGPDAIDQADPIRARLQRDAGGSGGFDLRHLVRRFRQRHAEGGPGWDQLGQSLDVAHFHAQRARDVAEGGARLERPERDDLADR